VLTNGAGNFASWLHRFFRYHGLAKGHKTQLAPTNGAMGYGVPAGIAASILTGRIAFTIAGDGDFLMNGQELATACSTAPRASCCCSTTAPTAPSACTRSASTRPRVSGSRLRNPDFCALARAYGYAAERMTDTAEFEPALAARAGRRPGTLIEVLLSEEVITTRGTQEPPSSRVQPSLLVQPPSWPVRPSSRGLSWPEPSLQLPWLISFFGWAFHQ
jgi:acetolactate synthase I/II/III large subunit